MVRELLEGWDRAGPDSRIKTQRLRQPGHARRGSFSWRTAGHQCPAGDPLDLTAIRSREAAGPCNRTDPAAALGIFVEAMKQRSDRFKAADPGGNCELPPESDRPARGPSPSASTLTSLSGQVVRHEAIGDRERTVARSAIRGPGCRPGSADPRKSNHAKSPQGTESPQEADSQ